MVQQKENKILIHACCGICSGYPISLLKDMGYEPVVYFCNPNLDTEEEYERRLNAQKTVCEYHGVDLIAEEYNHQDFLDAAKGLENEPERGARCTLCYRLRLARTAEEAAKRGFDWFASTLTLSPLKDAARLNRIGEEEGRRCGVNWLVSDFKKRDGYLRSTEITRACGMYRQEYCGCIYSLAERCRQGAPASAQKEV